ncbi:methylmalonyl Co-A mutase-associated GTPase MeaB [Prescottella defluvii]|nr:methylmalonyl Co-A mutase-associated GTPase MeaB [Prescottella defluvii]
MTGLVDELLAGNEASLARALTILERGGPDAASLRRLLRPHTGRALVVGLTGPPGAGKSSLIGAMVTVLRRSGARVAVLAVDPSSPVSGGAVLGDRTRMGTHACRPRGVHPLDRLARVRGGLAHAVPGLIDAVDAAGWDVVLLETVGSGQSDVEITEFADVAVLVSVPGLGDDLQAIKAGVLELADVLVVNKADLPGADNTARQLERMLRLRRTDAVRPPVIRTSAEHGTGVEDLVAAVGKATRADGPVRRLRRELVRGAELTFARRLREQPLDDACAAVFTGARDFEDVVAELTRS